MKKQRRTYAFPSHNASGSDDYIVYVPGERETPAVEKEGLILQDNEVK